MRNKIVAALVGIVLALGIASPAEAWKCDKHPEKPNCTGTTTTQVVTTTTVPETTTTYPPITVTTTTVPQTTTTTTTVPDTPDTPREIEFTG